ncbi:unnamed protein product [Amoebophrya sp. A25]|nr:unnamed protein product [Amoebophrya sp. A25]|eukprot:GSA25T00022999001.1
MYIFPPWAESGRRPCQEKKSEQLQQYFVRIPEVTTDGLVSWTDLLQVRARIRELFNVQDDAKNYDISFDVEEGLHLVQVQQEQVTIS